MLGGNGRAAQSLTDSAERPTADWEVGYATAHINKPLWRKTPGRFATATVAASTEPTTTMGGMRVLPDVVLADLRPQDSAMLILPGNDIWNTEKFVPWTDKVREFFAAGVPVAAICGATAGLAIAGLLDDREHTSNAAEFLVGTGYAGADHYRDMPAVDDCGLLTGNAHAPVEFAGAIFARLEVFEPQVLTSWLKLYRDQDPAGLF